MNESRITMTWLELLLVVTLIALAVSIWTLVERQVAEDFADAEPDARKHETKHGIPGLTRAVAETRQQLISLEAVRVETNQEYDQNKAQVASLSTTWPDLEGLPIDLLQSTSFEVLEQYGRERRELHAVDMLSRVSRPI